jgi:hypothetical protein
MDVAGVEGAARVRAVSPSDAGKSVTNRLGVETNMGCLKIFESYVVPKSIPIKKQDLPVLEAILAWLAW